MAVTVSGLFIYPVKSLGGISLETARLNERGLEYDRLWMVVDQDGTMVTQRTEPQLALIRTTLDLAQNKLWLNSPQQTLGLPLAGDPRDRRVQVAAWKDRCEAFDQGSEASFFLAGVLGHSRYRIVRMADDFVRPVRNVQQTGQEIEVGFADGYPLLIVSESSLGALNNRLEQKGRPQVPMDRFRPNIIVRGCQPHEEDQWAGISIGQVLLQGVTPCKRCDIVTTDQKTGERGKEPLATLATYRRSGGGVMFGMNYVHLTQGTISLGDEVQELF
jgi:uncharacterized protein